MKYRYLKYGIIGFIAIAIIILLFIIYQFLSVPLILASDYSQIYVEETDVIDYNIMRNPSQKYSVLLQLSDDLRYEISEYMKTNNYKLRSGEHNFRIQYTDSSCRKFAKDKKWINALIYGEYVNGKRLSGFMFEKIDNVVF